MEADQNTMQDLENLDKEELLCIVKQMAERIKELEGVKEKKVWLLKENVLFTNLELLTWASSVP